VFGQIVADVFGSMLVSLGKVVLVCGFVGTDWRENAPDTVVGNEVGSREFIVVIGIDELEQEFEVLGVVLVELDDRIHRLLSIEISDGECGVSARLTLKLMVDMFRKYSDCIHSTALSA
jgi:hypothetical protein